jgi:hypothetical protein
MRGVIGILVLVSLGAAAWSQGDSGEPVQRFGIPANPDKYPQNKPDVALSSAVKAVELGKIDYLLAHLVDPVFVDKHVQEYRGQINRDLKEQARTLLAFERFVDETRDHFRSDPGILKELSQFARAGKWDVKDSSAEATVASIPGRHVFMKKFQQGWVLENRQK